MVSIEEEKEVTMGILRKALEALETEISEQTIFSVNK